MKFPHFCLAAALSSTAILVAGSADPLHTIAATMGGIMAFVMMLELNGTISPEGDSR